MAERNYWLHRISGGTNGWQLAHQLLKEKNLISIGWSKLSTKEAALDIQTKGEYAIKELYKKEKWELSRGRWSLHRFIYQMKKGDYVVIPGWKDFTVYEIISDNILCNADIPEEWLDYKGYSICDKSINDSNGATVDLGFYREVCPLRDPLPRDGYAPQELASRMKIRQTNADINDLSEQIEEVLLRELPINIHEDILKKTEKVVLSLIRKELDADKFERLVEWYLYKIGADDVTTPSKSGSPTEDGDADKVAYFEKLKFVLLVQVKKHEGTTGDWAVKQISSFDYNNEFNGYTTGTWVISSADAFSANALDLAKQKNARLLTGLDFARLIVEEGVDNMPILERGKSIRNNK